MSNLEMIEHLCRMTQLQAEIIRGQAAALEQLGAVCMEEERAEVEREMSGFLAEIEEG